MQTDVLVLGASAAGLAATFAAAREGARVTLVERRDDLLAREPPANVAFDALWPREVPRPASTVRRRLDGVRIRTSVGDALDVDAPLSVLHRGRFDQHLADQARALGADVRLGARDARVRDDRTARVDGAELSPRVLILADGVHGHARRFVKPVRDPAAVAHGVAHELGAPGADDARHVTITLGAHAPGGRSQLTPLGGGKWAHWTFVRGVDVDAAARRALALDITREGWPAGVAERATLTARGDDPVFTIPRQLVAPRVMVVGGAAGQGGIEAGLAAGALAGGIAARGDDVRAYERAWTRANLRGYVTLRRATDRLARMDDATLARVLGAWRGTPLAFDDLGRLASGPWWRRVAGAARLAARNPRGAARVVAALTV